MCQTNIFFSFSFRNQWVLCLLQPVASVLHCRQHHNWWENQVPRRCLRKLKIKLTILLLLRSTILAFYLRQVRRGRRRRATNLYIFYINIILKCIYFVFKSYQLLGENRSFVHKADQQIKYSVTILQLSEMVVFFKVAAILIHSTVVDTRAPNHSGLSNAEFILRFAACIAWKEQQTFKIYHFHQRSCLLGVHKNGANCRRAVCSQSAPLCSPAGLIPQQ